MTLVFAAFAIVLAGLSAVQLGNIDETARRLRLQRQWDEIRPFVRLVPEAAAEVALPRDLLADYQGLDARRFFALWADDGSLVTASSALMAMHGVSLGAGAPPRGLADVGPIVDGQSAAHVLTEAVDLAGSRLWLSVGHMAWSSDALLRDIEGTLLRQTLLTATGLTAVMALIVVLLVRRRLAPVRSFAQYLGDLDQAGAMIRLDQGALPAEVRVLAAAFEQVLARLECAAKQQQRFSADAAHQLLTPLSILQARLDAGGGSVASSELRGDVSRMARIVDQLMSLARNAGRVPVRETVDLRRLCEAVICEIAPIAIRSGKELALEAPAVACWAVCDPVAVSEALSNLVQNALDHTPAGGCVEVEVSPASQVSVLDRGPGFLPRDEPRLFLPFFTTRSGNGGSGLGLAIVSEIMQSHGGNASAERRNGGGAVFTLNFWPCPTAGEG